MVSVHFSGLGEKWCQFIFLALAQWKNELTPFPHTISSPAPAPQKFLM
jgi:hypothetical protein